MINLSKSLMAKSVDNKTSVVDTDRVYYPRIAKSDNEVISFNDKWNVGNLSFRQMELMYDVNPWVRSIVDKIIERAVNISHLVKPVKTFLGKDDKIPDNIRKEMDRVNEFLNSPNSNNESFSQIKKKLYRDLLLYDAGGYEIVTGTSANNKTVEIFSVSGDSVKLNTDKNGIFRKNAYLQVDGSLKVLAKWMKDEFIYFMLNPKSNKIYGLSPLESLNQTITAELYTSNYNLDFYFNNATPRYAVLMEGMGIGQGTAAMTRFRQWYESELKGKPHKPIILGTEQGKIQFEKVGLTNEEMQFQEYSKWLLLKIMAVYKMQPVVMGVIDIMNMNKTDVKSQLNMFKSEAISPLVNLLNEKLNMQILFKTFGFKNCYVDSDLDLIDRKEQAEIDKIYLSNGVITINEIRTKGLGMTPVSWGNVPYLQNNIVPFGIGPNGQALPINVKDQNVPTPQDQNIPNIATTAKKSIIDYIDKEFELPIGWEGMETNEKIEIITKLLEEKEKLLSKVFITIEKNNKNV